MFDAVQRKMHARSAALLCSIESGLDRIMLSWLMIAGFATALRIAFSPVPANIEPVALAPYILLVFAPAASMMLALRWFADGDRLPQPGLRFARLGTWRDLGRAAAMRHPLYGAGGLMVSLLVGMLLNVPLRAVEFLAAMPPVAGPSPAWLAMLRTMMTIDVVLMTSLYVIAFVAALRRVASFPRLLIGIWALDIALQLVTAQLVAGAPGLPAPVASALHLLLDGNLKKVGISIMLWLPYLLLSTRVNLTYRHRLPA